MREQREAAILRQQFQIGNRKNYILSLVGKLLVVVMSISSSLIFTFVVESLEYQSIQKFLYGLAMVGVYIVANMACGLFRRKYQNTYLRKALTQFKNYVFSKILRQPISSYASGDTAKFISAFSNDLNSIEQNYLVGELNLFVEILNYVVTAAVLLILNVPLGITLVVSSLIAILVSFRFGGKVVKNEAETMEKASDFVAQTKDLLSGFTHRTLPESAVPPQSLRISGNPWQDHGSSPQPPSRRKHCLISRRVRLPQPDPGILAEQPHPTFHSCRHKFYTG